MQFERIVEVGKLTLHIFGDFLEIHILRGQECKMYGMNGKYEANELIPQSLAPPEAAHRLPSHLFCL